MGIINELFTNRRHADRPQQQQLSYLAALAAQARNSRAAWRRRRQGGED